MFFASGNSSTVEKYLKYHYVHLLKLLEKVKPSGPQQKFSVGNSNVPYAFSNLQLFTCHKLLYIFPPVEKEKNKTKQPTDVFVQPYMKFFLNSLI